MHKDSGDLGQLQPAAGAVKKSKRIGRGRGSGHGDTATKGNKGAQSRAGYKSRARFEGGQMPLHRRLPKRGFNVPERTEYIEVALTALKRLEGEVVTPDTLRSSGLVKGRGPIVLLGGGGNDDTPLPYRVSVHRITAATRTAIEAAGGSVEILPLDPLDRRVKKGPKPKPKKPKKAKAKAE